MIKITLHSFYLLQEKRNFDYEKEKILHALFASFLGTVH